LSLIKSWVLHHLAAARTLISTLNFIFNNVLRNVDALGLLGGSFFCTYSAVSTDNGGRVEVAVHIHEFLAVLLHHSWVSWLHPSILGLNPFFPFSIGERIGSELLRFVLRTLASSTTAHFLRVISESKTVTLEIRISCLDSRSESLRVIKLGVTIKEFRCFVYIIDDVVVDVVVVYDVGDIAWLHYHLFLAFRPALVR
jgi:hypothetical protein